MFADQWSRILAATVTPTVVVSAAALLCLALYNRLAAIITRLRLVQRERLSLQEQWEAASGEDGDPMPMRLTCLSESLEAQTVRMGRRARLIRSALLCLLGAMASVLLSALLNGMTIVWTAAVYPSAAVFGIGMILMLSGIGCAAAEMKVSLDPAELEVLVVGELIGADDVELRTAKVELARNIGG